MAAVSLKKNLGHSHVYHCVATPFFNNSLETSGNWGDQLDFWETSLPVPICSSFHFMMLQMSPEICKAFPSRWEHMLLYNLYIHLSALTVPFQMCKLLISQPLIHLHTFKDAFWWLYLTTNSFPLFVSPFDEIFAVSQLYIKEHYSEIPPQFVDYVFVLFFSDWWTWASLFIPNHVTHLLPTKLIVNVPPAVSFHLLFHPFVAHIPIFSDVLKILDELIFFIKITLNAWAMFFYFLLRIKTLWIFQSMTYLSSLAWASSSTSSWRICSLMTTTLLWTPALGPLR